MRCPLGPLGKDAFGERRKRARGRWGVGPGGYAGRTAELLDGAIFEEKHPLLVAFEDVSVVGGDHHGRASGMRAFEQGHDVLGDLIVEVPRGFVREKKDGVVGQGPRNGDPLLFASR